MALCNWRKMSPMSEFSRSCCKLLLQALVDDVDRLVVVAIGVDSLEVDTSFEFAEDGPAHHLEAFARLGESYNLAAEIELATLQLAILVNADGQMKTRTLCWLGACILFLIVGCRSPATRADFVGLVDIGGGRKMFIECRGAGSPTVILVSGTQGASDDWTHAADPADPAGQPKPSDSAVFPQVSKFTRVCAYDRPGTPRFNGVLSSSTPVSQPTSAQDGVADLHALLNAAHEPGPYVLVGASWGGMIVKLYASTYPKDVSGLVFVDAASEFLKTTLTPAQWAGWMQKIKNMADSKGVEVPDYEPSVETVRAASPAPSVTAVVLTSDKPWDLQVGEGGSTWPAWLAAQDRLAGLLKANHITQTNSGHPIGIEQPQLVVEAIREVVDAAQSSKPK